MPQPNYTFIEAVRTLRKERGLSYEEAKRQAFKHFDAKGYAVPESMSGLRPPDVPKPAVKG